MKRSVKIIFVICSLAVLGVIVLQVFWLKDYITVSKNVFAREAETSFEEAIKKELTVRGDSIEHLLYRRLLDSSEHIITILKPEADKDYIFTIADARNNNDEIMFGLREISKNSNPTREDVAYRYAKNYRIEEFDRNVLMYNRRSSLNNFLQYHTEKLGFNTESLARIYKGILAARGIHEPFIFQFGDVESDLEKARFSDSIRITYPYITRPQPTNNAQKDYNYLVALFKSPRDYLTTKLTWQLVSSGMLIFIFALSLYYLVRIVYREKKLATIKNDFISNISHEFKTPISTAMAAIEAMEHFDVLQNPDKTKRYLHASKNEINRLSDLVNKILDISLYEKRELQLKFENVHVGEMLETLINNFKLIKNRHVQFELSVSCAQPVTRADRVHLYNSLSNIIDNGIKYSGNQPEIKIQLSCTTNELLIEIKDNGIGIPATSLPNIFDKFYRVPSAEGYRVKGFGLGLYYTKSIIQQHNGWCKVESIPLKGTTFKIGLPK